MSRRIDRLAVTLVHALLWTLPGRFRRRHGAAMLETFRLRWRDARRRGGLAAAAVLGRSLVDVLRTAVAERRDDSFEPRTGRSPVSPRRSIPGDGPLTTFLHDLRQALRGLRKRPGYSLTVVFTLALGIGANTAIFSVVDAVLLQPLPFPDADRLISVWGRFEPESGFDFPIFPLSPPEYFDYRQQSETMQDVAAYSAGDVTLTGGDGVPEQAPAASVTPNLFRVLGVEAARGRTFTESEGLPDAEPVVVLSHGLWQRRYGGAPEIVGDTVRVYGEERTVVGVMPPGFSFPGSEMRLWLPMALDPGDSGNRQSHYLRAIGRLAADGDLASAQAEMQALMATWEAEYPDIHTGHHLWLQPRLEDLVGNSRQALLLLWGASGFVLLIVCANVASMLLARAQDRGRELALRGALGAGRARLVRLLLAESGILALAGGALGVGLASGGVRALLTIDPDSVPRGELVGVDARVLLVALVVSLGTGLLFGIGPALRASARDPAEALHDAARGSSAGGSLVLRRGLIVAEVALTFLLVLGAGLMIRSFDRLLQVDPGFEPEGRLAARISLPSSEYPDAADVEAFWAELLSGARALPMVRSASAGTAVPLSGNSGSWDFELEGRPEPPPGELAWNADVGIVRPGYFEALGTRILRGREFRREDDLDAPAVTVLNERMARTFFPDGEVLGRRLRVRGRNDAEWLTVVGVVEDVRYGPLADDPRPGYYLAHAQTPMTAGRAYRELTVFLATDGDPAGLVAPLRRLTAELDPALPLAEVRTLREAIHDAAASDRFTTALLSLFALVALVLGSTGVYGVLAYAVARRTREIGIRKALGASHRGLARTIASQAMLPVVAGLGLGGLASIWLARGMERLLYGIAPFDAATYVLVATVLVGVSLAACLVPVRRALRVDALEALRAE